MTSFPVAANLDAWWLTTVASWNHLHAIPRAALDPDDEDTVEALCGGPWPVRTATCGCTAEWTIPGVFSRLGMARCARCCRKLKIAAGDGTPANAGGSVHTAASCLRCWGMAAMLTDMPAGRQNHGGHQ